MIKSDKWQRIAKSKEQKVAYFKLLVTSPLHFDPQSPQEAVPGKLNPAKGTCPGLKVTSNNGLRKCNNKKLIILMP